MGETLLPNSVSLSLSLSLSLSVGPSKVKEKGNQESLFEAGDRAKGTQKWRKNLKKDTREKESEEREGGRFPHSKLSAGRKHCSHPDG